MIKQCVICGAEFSAPPSSKKSTCSAACRKERARLAATGRKIEWSADARARRSAAMKPAGAEKNKELTAAALAIPEGQRGPQHRDAKIWVLKSPSGEIVEVVNLLDWARRNAREFEPGTDDIDATANRIRAGFCAIASSMRGVKSRERQVGSYKGWQLICLPREKRRTK